ncbi:hypothetical protein ACTXT7_005771 [Hymenolepis weldensis]
MTLRESEAARRRGVSMVFLRPKKLPAERKSEWKKRLGGCVRADPSEVPTVMHAHEVSTNRGGFRALESMQMQMPM